MERARARRRLLALSTLAALAAAGFAIGAVLGSGSGVGSSGSGSGGGTTPTGGGGSNEAGTTTGGSEGSSGEAAKPSLAETLRPGELAGERVVVGIDGTGITPELRAAIAQGKVAGVVLFEADFPSRGAGRALIDELQA